MLVQHLVLPESAQLRRSTLPQLAREPASAVKAGFTMNARRTAFPDTIDGGDQKPVAATWLQA